MKSKIDIFYSELNNFLKINRRQCQQDKGCFVEYIENKSLVENAALSFKDKIQLIESIFEDINKSETQQLNEIHIKFLEKFKHHLSLRILTQFRKSHCFPTEETYLKLIYLMQLPEVYDELNDKQMFKISVFMEMLEAFNLLETSQNEFIQKFKEKLIVSAIKYSGQPLQFVLVWMNIITICGDTLDCVDLEWSLKSHYPKEMTVLIHLMKHTNKKSLLDLSRASESNNPLICIPKNIFDDRTLLYEAYYLCMKLGISRRQINEEILSALDQEEIHLLDSLYELESLLILKPEKRSILLESVNQSKDPISFIMQCGQLVKADIISSELFSSVEITDHKKFSEFVDMMLERKEQWPDFQDPKNAFYVKKCPDKVKAIVSLLILNTWHQLNDKNRVVIRRFPDCASAAVCLVMWSLCKGEEEARKILSNMNALGKDMQIEAIDIWRIEQFKAQNKKGSAKTSAGGIFKQGGGSTVLKRRHSYTHGCSKSN